jgi:MFS family permease
MGRLGDGRLRRLTTVGAVAVMLAGCVLSALPAGFPAFLAGRVLQGAGLGLIPLATAVARDDLPADRSRSAIVLIGVTTAAGIGIGYPLVGLLAQGLGLYAPFWFAVGLSALALAAALVALPDSPARPARVDVTGAVLLGAGIAGLLLVLAQGPAWGWTSAATLAGAVTSVALLAMWIGWEQRVRHPLVELRLLGRRPVLAANLTVFLIAIGFYPSETGSAISFYQLVRTVAYAIASALSATVLVASTPAGRRFPADAGYSVAAGICIAVLLAALAVSVVFVMRRPVLGRKRA